MIFIYKLFRMRLFFFFIMNFYRRLVEFIIRNLYEVFGNFEFGMLLVSNGGGGN